jgi:hypothetical protein
LAVLLGNDIANKMAIVVPNKKIGEIDYLFWRAGGGGSGKDVDLYFVWTKWAQTISKFRLFFFRANVFSVGGAHFIYPHITFSVFFPKF